MTATTVQRSPETQEAIELLTELLKGFTARHEDLQVNGADAGPSKSILAVKCHPWDYPKVVGKQGKNHWSLQRILTAIGARQGRLVEFTLLPSERREKGPDEFRPDPKWKPGPILLLLNRVLSMAMGPGEYVAKCDQTPELATLVVIVDEVTGELMELAQATHAIFHAIGKTQGRKVTVEFREAKK